VLIILYEIKLLPYVNVVPLAWFFITSAFFSFFLGTITLVSSKNLFSRDLGLTKQSTLYFKIFSDNGKTLKYTILLFSGIGIYAGIQHWMILIDMFGSLPMAFVNTNIIYKFNTLGGIKGVIPFISSFGYAAVFFSGIYTSYKGKISFLTFLPFVGVILKGLATAGRVGMLFAFFEFFFTFFLFRHLLNNDSQQRFRFSRKNASLAFSILIIFIIISSSLVRIARVGTKAGTEKYAGMNQELRESQDNLIVTPSLYLYLSSDIGVLSQYVKFGGENTKFGENTFMLFHYLLVKFDLIKKPSDLQKGYYIPMWTNTGTYIRELHADFGLAGVFVVPYLLGMLITWLWFKFYEQNGIITFALLIFFNLIIGFSFLMMITRLDIWGVSLVILILSIPIIEKIAVVRSNTSIINQFYV
jgi:oligosaccharide repeat unit polymerase